MRILLRKVRKERQPFSYQQGSLSCVGEFYKTKDKEVALEGKIVGALSLVCDRCAERFEKPLKERFDLCVVDRPLKVEDSLDVIECENGFIDFDAICRSEIASIQSAYHLCPACAVSDFDEIEL